MSKQTYHPDRGDLIEMNFQPAAGREIDKRRPAVVLSDRQYNRRTGLCVAVPASTDLTRNFYGVGATIDAGPGLVFLYWGHAADGKGSATPGFNVGGLVKGVNTGATQWEVSYTYLLSARTLLYTGYVKILNESNAGYAFDTNVYPTLCGTYPNGGCGKPGGFVLGMAHFF